MVLPSPPPGSHMRLLPPKTHGPLRADVLRQGAVTFLLAAPKTSLRLVQDGNCSAILVRLFNIPCPFFSCGIGVFSDTLGNFVN